MLALRRHLDLLSEQVLENDYLVNQSRYLCLCIEHITCFQGSLFIIIFLPASKCFSKIYFINYCLSHKFLAKKSKCASLQAELNCEALCGLMMDTISWLTNRCSYT